MQGLLAEQNDLTLAIGDNGDTRDTTWSSIVVPVVFLSTISHFFWTQDIAKKSVTLLTAKR